MDKSGGVNVSTGNSSIDRESFFEWGTYHHLDSQELRMLIPVILGVICVLGFAGNITAMGVLLSNARKSKLSLINSLILNLTFADSLVLAFTVPFKAATFSRASWTLGWFVCKSCDWFLHSCMVAKSFTIAIMAKACYRCQRRGSKTQNLRTQMRSRKLTLMLLSLTITMAIMWLPQWVYWVWTHHIMKNEGPMPPLLLSLSSQLLMFSISLVNPLITLSLSEEFRESYKDLWRRLTLRKPLPKPKQGPHTPTAQKSPSPRPETAGHPLAHRAVHNEESTTNRAPEPSAAGTESPTNKDGNVLPDVEQFWHERETGSLTEVNDPVPWEHQDLNEVKK